MTLDKLKRIKLLLLDVDGVLTDGSVIYHDTGAETKVFHIKDGLGIRMLMDAGIEVGIVTGRTSRALLHRCDNLGISLVFEQVRDKVTAAQGGAGAVREVCEAILKAQGLWEKVLARFR
jgi:3-deoxy-D-manno-octulosonate 8-phosphate phosphatase (KDO 8-P phosphatase)